MSDNTSDEEQQQQMEEISICADIWLEVFAFISPLELGHTMALISDRFDARVDEHFKLRKWSLGSLQIVRSTDGNGAQIVKKNSVQLLPIPQGPIPSKVIGFEWIGIRYIDRSVIEFLQRLRRLFNSSEATVAIGTFYEQSRSWGIIWQEIWPLISDNICGFLLDFSVLDRLRQLSPAILRNCTKLQSMASRDFLPDFPADDNANASSAQAVAKWLLTPREDGRPKMLRCGFDSTAMEGLKRAFVNASKSANFIIRLDIYHCISSFELWNISTRERLTFRREDWPFLLVRCPIERDEDKWAKWEKEAIERKWFRQSNCIGIHFNNRDIGDGMLDANDKGPSEPKK